MSGILKGSFKMYEPKELVIRPEVDHFWAGSESLMAERSAISSPDI